MTKARNDAGMANAHNGAGTMNMHNGASNVKGFARQKLNSQTGDAKAKSRSYFDRHHGSLFAHGGYWNLDYRHTLRRIEMLEPSNLIDIGCGPGGFLSRAHKTFPNLQLYGLDLSENMVSEVRKRFDGQVEAIVGDAENMPLADGSFDVVTCNMSIHHYPHPQAAVNEMFRILKPGGTLLLNDMDCIPPVRTAANVLFPRLPGGDVKMYSRNEIMALLERAGFTVTMYRKISPFSFLCVAQKNSLMRLT